MSGTTTIIAAAGKKLRASGERDLHTVIGAAEQYIEDSEYSKGIHAYSLSAHASNETLLFGLCVSTYIAKLDAECAYLGPEFLDNFEIKRDQQGRISSAHDSSKALSDKILRVIQALEGAKQRGAGHVIIENHPTAVAGVIIPARFHVETVQPATDKKFKVAHRIIYTSKGRIRTFLTPQHIRDVLGHPYLSLSQLKDTLAAVSDVIEVEPTFQLEEKHADLNSLREALNESGIKAKQRSLISKLLSLGVANLSYEERIDHFEKTPSLDFAFDLKLCAHHKSPLVHRSNLRTAELVALAQIADTDDIVMSSVALDARSYHSLPQDVGTTLVHRWTGELGVKTTTGYKDVKSIFKLSKLAYLRQLTAIQKSLGVLTSTATPSAAQNEGTQELEIVDLDF